MDAIERITEVKRARPERIALATSHKARQIGLALNHLFGWVPIGPFRQPGNPFNTRPGETFAADPNSVTQRLAVAEYQIEIGVRRIDDDRAGRLLSIVIDEGATELRRQFLFRASFRPKLRWQCRHVVGIADLISATWRQVVVSINGRKRPISRRWIIVRGRVGLMG